MEHAVQPPDTTPEKTQQLNRYVFFLSQDSSNIPLLIDTLQLSLELGAIETAKTLIDEHQENAKHNAGFNALAGHTLLILGQFSEAAEWLLNSISLGEKDPSVYLNLAHCYHFLNAPDRTIAVLNEHTALAELFPSIYYVLYARALHITDQPQLAIDMLEQFHAKNDYTSESAGLLSLILFEQNQQTDKALKLANDALAKNPKAVEALLARTSLHLDAGHYEQALIDIQQATEFHPKVGRAWSSLAQVEFNNLQFREAQVAASKAVVHMTDHIGTWHLLGWAHVMLNELPDALAAFEKSYELDRSFAETHGGLAAVYAHLGESRKANQHIKLADKLDAEGFASTYAKIILLKNNNENEKVNTLFDSFKHTFNSKLDNTPQKLIEKRLYELSKQQSENTKIH